MIHRKTSKRGFMIVEMIVYLSIMVVVAMALITTFLSLDTVFLRNRTDRALTESASLALERMSRAMRSADVVDAGLSTLGTNPGVLTLDEGATTTQFYLTGGMVMMSVNGAEVGPLTGGGVVVDELIFTEYVGSTTSMVRVTLTLTASSSVATTTRTYYTSAVLRGSYE